MWLVLCVLVGAFGATPRVDDAGTPLAFEVILLFFFACGCSDAAML